ncbi:XRE family transcriptional regulator [Brevibacillus laterosporus]|nr:helix-turn-helix transcriptional regulator [Brevibacillus laterosporus]TPG68656.1 XRE family transcriptional regulator [Brevibacillus laterosporus]
MDYSSTDIEKYIGPIMTACRKRAGLSQEKLAELLYISRSSISKLENNNATPNLDLFLEWGKVTNSKDAVVAMFCGKKGVGWLIAKLNEEGYWIESS